jgi:hypothetical protein
VCDSLVWLDMLLGMGGLGGDVCKDWVLEYL